MKRALLIAALALATLSPPASAQITVGCFAPTVTPCGGGWHRSPVTIKWTIEPPFAPILGCVDETLSDDTPATTRGCSVEDPDGGTASRGVTVKIDMTAPIVTAPSPSRPPDANGWYRSPLQVAFTGADATSGLDGCTSASYGGPDGTASVTGTCRDKAGNVSAPGVFDLRYDSTPPTIARVDSASGDHVIRVDWSVADAAAVELWRSPGVNGESQSVVNRGTDGNIADRDVRNGRRYDYRLLAVDEAGNTVTRTFSVTPGLRLLSPAAGAVVAGPPVLRWTKVRGARYYNVQLLRNGRKLLSAWPGKPRFALERRWRFDGHRFRLKSGKYTWLVWPGRGKRSRNDYGRLIGRATFTVAPS